LPAIVSVAAVVISSTLKILTLQEENNRGDYQIKLLEEDMKQTIRRRRNQFIVLKQSTDKKIYGYWEYKRRKRFKGR